MNRGSCSSVTVNIITRVTKNAQRASTYLRGLGNLCSSVVYNQGRLTLIF